MMTQKYQSKMNSNIMILIMTNFIMIIQKNYQNFKPKRKSRKNPKNKQRNLVQYQTFKKHKIDLLLNKMMILVKTLQ